MCRRKGRRKNIKRKRKTRKREKVKKKGIKTKAMGNTEKRKRKRINTGTRRKSTRTKRRTRTRIKRKAASLRRLELPLYLGLLLEGNFTREMNIKIDTLAQIKGEMNISSEIGIETSAQRKASALISFTSSLASLLLRQRTQNLCRSWGGGSEMQRRVLKVSWRRDFQLSAKGMKRQAGCASRILEIWLNTRKRTKRKDLLTIRWMGKLSGVNLKLELMQYLPAFLQWQKANLKESPGHWKKMLRSQERKNKNLKKDVMTNQERKTRIKIGKRKVMESKKTRKKRRKRKRRQRAKVNTRKARRIHQEISIRMTLLVLLTINFHLYPRKALLVQSTWELTERGRMLKLMVSCMVS